MSFIEGDFPKYFLCPTNTYCPGLGKVGKLLYAELSLQLMAPQDWKMLYLHLACEIKRFVNKVICFYLIAIYCPLFILEKEEETLCTFFSFSLLSALTFLSCSCLSPMPLYTCELCSESCCFLGCWL